MTTPSKLQWSDEHAIIMAALALHRAGKIKTIWAIDGRYRIGDEYASADHYTAEGLRLLIANEGNPVRLRVSAPGPKPMAIEYRILRKGSSQCLTA